MRILMLFQCTAWHLSREVRTLFSHTDKKYTVTQIVWRTGTFQPANAAAAGIRSAKLCAAQGHRIFSRRNCVAHRDAQHTPTTPKPHPGAFSAFGMRLELCGAQGQLRLHRPVLAHDFLRQFAISF